MKVLKFYGDWCAPCKALSTTMATMDIKVEIENVDVDVSPEMMRTYGVRSVPTMILLNDGGSELKRVSGNITKTQIEQFLTA